MKTATEYEVIRHGVENSQYFQGCGTAFTEFDEAFTGIGWTEEEAFDDARENMAQCGWDASVDGPMADDGLSALSCKTVADILEIDTEDEDAMQDCDAYWYVTIRVKAN